MESIKELRKICYEGSKAKRPLYMEWVTMRFSIYVTRLLLYAPITADQVTISMVILAILGSVLMAFGSLKMIFIGILIIHFTVLLDNVNGEIARYRKEGNMTGTFLEQFYHEITVPFIFFFLAYGVFVQTGYKSILIFGFLCAVFSKSVVLPAVNSAVIKNALRDKASGKADEKLKKYATIIGKKANIKGGGTEIGAKMYGAYDLIREFWSAPFNIVIINLIVIFEIIKNHYFSSMFFPEYSLIYMYLALYGAFSVIIQAISFIVHYKGRTVYHYYVALFGKK